MCYFLSTFIFTLTSLKKHTRVKVLKKGKSYKQIGTSKTCLHSSHYEDICPHSSHQADCTIAIADLRFMTAWVLEIACSGINFMGVNPILIVCIFIGNTNYF